MLEARAETCPLDLAGGVHANGANSVRPINAPKSQASAVVDDYSFRVYVTLRNARGTLRICSGSVTADAGACLCLAPGRQLRSPFLSWKQGHPVMIFNSLEQGAMSDRVTCLDLPVGYEES